MRSQGTEGSLAQAVIRRMNVLRPLSVDAVAALERAILEGLFRAGPGEEQAVSPAALSAEAAGERLELSLDAPIASAAAGPVSAANARLRATAAGPYPDFARRREQGPVVAHAELAGGRLAYAGQGLRSGLV